MKPVHPLLLDGTVERAHLEILPLTLFARFVRVQKKPLLSLKTKKWLHLNGHAVLVLCLMPMILPYVRYVVRLNLYPKLYLKLYLKLSLKVQLLPKLKRLKLQNKSKALLQKRRKQLNLRRQRQLK